MEGIVRDALAMVLTEGGLGFAVAIVFGAVVFFLYRELRSCHRERIEEAMRLVAISEKLAHSISANTIALESNNRAMEARTRAQESMDKTITTLLKQQDVSDERVMEALTEIKRMMHEGLSRVEDIRLVQATQQAGGGR